RRNRRGRSPGAVGNGRFDRLVSPWGALQRLLRCSFRRRQPAAWGSLVLAPLARTLFPTPSSADIGHRILLGYRPGWPCRILCTDLLHSWLFLTNGIPAKP